MCNIAYIALAVPLIYVILGGIQYGIAESDTVIIITNIIDRWRACSSLSYLIHSSHFSIKQCTSGTVICRGHLETRHWIGVGALRHWRVNIALNWNADSLDRNNVCTKSVHRHTVASDVGIHSCYYGWWTLKVKVNDSEAVVLFKKRNLWLSEAVAVWFRNLWLVKVAYRYNSPVELDRDQGSSFAINRYTWAVTRSVRLCSIILCYVHVYSDDMCLLLNCATVYSYCLHH